MASEGVSGQTPFVMNLKMKKYYARRAAEYEDIYLKPKRQEDLFPLKALLRGAFSGLEVQEIACGTGYWTQFLAKTAISILATDINPEVLELAREQEYGSCKVSFAIAEAYGSGEMDGQWNSAFLGFWRSHIPRQRIPEFLAALYGRLPPGSKVVMIDNLLWKGAAPRSRAGTMPEIPIRFAASRMGLPMWS